MCCRGVKRRRAKSANVIVEGPADLMGAKQKQKTRVVEEEEKECSDDEEADEDWEYEVVDAPPSRIKTHEWWDYVGRTFYDAMQRFRIVAVCKSGSTKQYFFRYVEADDLFDESDSAQWEHTPCKELLVASWCCFDSSSSS